MSSKTPTPATARSSSGPASLSEQSTLPSPRPVVPPETSPASRRSTSTPWAASACAVAAPTIPAPTTATRTAPYASPATGGIASRGLQREGGGERVGGVEQVLAHARDPRPAGDLRDHRAAPGDLRLLDEPAREAGADDGLVHERPVERELATGVQLGHARRGPRPAGGAVEPARVDGDGGAGVGAVAAGRGEDHVADAGDPLV